MLLLLIISRALARGSGYRSINSPDLFKAATRNATSDVSREELIRGVI